MTFQERLLLLVVGGWIFGQMMTMKAGKGEIIENLLITAYAILLISVIFEHSIGN